MSSSGSVVDLYLSVIGHTFSSFGSIFASSGLWIAHGLALALCFFGLFLAATFIALPIKFIAERILENTSASTPSNEYASSQSQEQDLEANVGSLEDLRITSVGQVPENATEEEARLIPKKPSDDMDPAMASRAPNDSTNEHIPLTNMSDPGPSNAGNGERATYSTVGENLDMASGSVDSDRGSDFVLEEHDAHPGCLKPVKRVSFWTSVR